ncbi:hypothetical protein J5N97_027274 [Dioscorea zingiberensis]|uniref:PGG domain-containing protein n=1 Tax=Dioscorea zingiberensis TaxID=325984 RepID=A0A9D5H7G2_9LILI|nr:hypothetical protein J5N97_027274 [Dioscorea zingiberensis]
MEGLSAFAGPYGTEMRPERRNMGFALLQAARSGDLKALATLLPPSSEAALSNKDISILISTQRKPESIFGVTAGGNTVLHIAAEHGQLEFAEEVCCREPSLVAAVNTRLETPLHCCAKPGHHQIVSLIINIARRCRDGGAYGLLDVVRTRNVHGETALHEASRSGHVQVVENLLAADVELASFVSDAGISPLYLAVMRKSQRTVKALLQYSSSVAGPVGQTALHASVVRCQVITRMLLDWNPILARLVDESNNTPLHYIAFDGDSSMARVLLEHDASTAYISNIDGYFPIHIAASKGHVKVIDELHKQCPDLLELLNYKGRSFLHVAVKKRRVGVVKYVLERKELEKLLNERDNDGNTPLHLAVKNKNPKAMVYELLKDKRVETCIMNNEGDTQLDLFYKLEPGMRFILNAQCLVIRCLADCGAVFSPKRPDHANHKMKRSLDHEDKESEKSISLSKNLAIASVLIATVTFAAGFTMPGGYRSDDGTSILAHKYPFKVFLISDTCAMVCSLIATVRIIYAGTPTVDNSIRAHHLWWSMTLLWISFACMSMAFGAATFAVVVPKVWGIGVLVCIISLGAPLATVLVTAGPVFSLQCAMINSDLDLYTHLSVSIDTLNIE